MCIIYKCHINDIHQGIIVYKYISRIARLILGHYTDIIQSSDNYHTTHDIESLEKEIK